MRREKKSNRSVWNILYVCLFFVAGFFMADSALAASVTVGQTSSRASSTYFYYNPGSGSAHTAINNAINAAASGASASSPGVVTIENASQPYEVTSHILAKSYVNIVGQSREGVTLKIASGLTPKAYGGPGTTGWGGTDSSSGDAGIINVWSNVTNVKIANMTLDGSCGDYYACGTNDRGHSEFNLMNVYRARNVIVDNVKFTNGKNDGIRNTGDSVEVMNSLFDMIGHDAVQGYGVTNQIFHNNIVAMRTNCGVRCSGDGSGCFVYNNEFYTGSGGGAALELQGGFSNVKIYNNYFHDISGAGGKYGGIGYVGQSPSGSGHEYYNNLFVNMPYAVRYVPSSSQSHHNIMIDCSTTVGGGSDNNNIKTESGYTFQKYGSNRAGNTYWTVTSGPLASAFSGRKIGIDGKAGGTTGASSGSGSSVGSGSSGGSSGGSGSSGSSGSTGSSGGSGSSTGTGWSGGTGSSSDSGSTGGSGSSGSTGSSGSSGGAGMGSGSTGHDTIGTDDTAGNGSGSGTGTGTGGSQVDASGATVLSPQQGSNNHTQINNALKGGGKVYLNEGTYVISDTIVLNSGNILSGDAKAIIKLVDNANWPKYKNMIEGIDVSNVRVTGFEVDGNRANNTTSDGASTACGKYYYTMIYFKNSSGIEVDNMYLHHNWNDILKFSSCDNVKFHHNTVRQPGHDVVYAIGSTNVWVYNNYIRIYCNSGVRPDGTQNIYIYNNDIARDEGAGGYAGIEVQGDSIVYICNNNIHDCKGGSVVDLSGGAAKIYYSGCPESGAGGTGAASGTGSADSSGSTGSSGSSGSSGSGSNGGTTTSNNGTSTTSRDGNGNAITTLTDCAGNTTTTVKDQSGNTISSATTDLRGDISAIVYDDGGNKVNGSTSQNGSGCTEVTYVDDCGNMATCTEYDNGDSMITFTDSDGEVIFCTTCTNNNDGSRLITTTDCAGYTTSTLIDKNGNVVTSTADPQGNVTTSTALNDSNGGGNTGSPDVYTETYTESATYVGARQTLGGDTSRDTTIGDSVIGDAGSTGSIDNRNEDNEVPEYFDPSDPMTSAAGTNGIAAALAPVSEALDALFDALSDAPETATGTCTAVEGSGGILPCGKSQDDPETDWNECETCDLCSMILMGQLTITFLIKIAAAAAALSMAFAGFVYVFALGKEDLITKSKAMIKYSLIGVVTIFIAWAIVDGVLTTLGYIDPMGDKWYTTC